MGLIITTSELKYTQFFKDILHDNWLLIKMPVEVCYIFYSAILSGYRKIILKFVNE